MRVVLAGGGTAGHIEPALATADALRRDDPSGSVLLLGTERGLETRLIPERGHRLALIPPVPLPRRPSAALLSLPRRVRAAVRAAGAVLEEERADVLVGFGGYVALPAYLAARRRKIPVVVHEANARPGLANRVGARWAAAVATAEGVQGLRGAQPIGIPLRRSVAGLDRAARREEAARTFDLDPARRTLLVFGGSQGARRLNEAVAAAVPLLRADGVQVLHAVGAGHVDAFADAATPADDDGPAYRPVGYLDRMDLAYAAADLALCRSGAMTCAELAAVGLPAVFVPLPHGNGEQRLNAGPAVAAGAGVLVEDEALDAARVVQETRALLGDPTALAAAGRAAAGLGHRDADATLVQIVAGVCRPAGRA